MSEKQESLKIMSFEGTTIIAAQDPDIVFGGAIFGAALMNISADRKFGTLAHKEIVYFLECL